MGKVLCTDCGNVLQIPRGYAGRVKCRRCQRETLLVDTGDVRYAGPKVSAASLAIAPTNNWWLAAGVVAFVAVAIIGSWIVSRPPPPKGIPPALVISAPPKPKTPSTIAQPTINVVASPSPASATIHAPVVALPPFPESRFCVVPVIGRIGAAVTSDDLSYALDAARTYGADYVVLFIDSPGGSVEEAQRIIRVIQSHRPLKLIAVVKEAWSAGAIIAMACPTIVMLPGSKIGAAVPYTRAKDGTPQDVDAKFHSIWDTEARAAAELGGHSSLVAKGMVDLDLALFLQRGPDGPVVTEDPTPKRLKAKGEILSLTANEAVACGLAAGVFEEREFTKAMPPARWVQVGKPLWADVGRRSAVSLFNANVKPVDDRLRQLASLQADVMRELQASEDDYRRLVQEEYARPQSVADRDYYLSQLQPKIAGIRKKADKMLADIESEDKVLREGRKQMEEFLKPPTPSAP